MLTRIDSTNDALHRISLWLQHDESLIIIMIIIFLMPRYLVPEDLEITNKEKKNYNGCNGLAASERVLK